MTGEEAIKYWDGLRKTFSRQLEKEENYFGRMHLQTSIDAIDTAISALRRHEQKRNVPLTLEELRGAAETRDPVWLVGAWRADTWAVIEKVHGEPWLHPLWAEYLVFGDDTPYEFYLSEYGDKVKAYLHRPKEANHA